MKRIDSEAETAALAAWKAGDRQRALSILMDTYGSHVYTFCCAALGDESAAEDVLQTVFVEVHDSLPRFAARSSLLTWVLGIARHRCLDSIRARRRWFSRFLPATAATDAQPDVSASADRRLEMRERSAVVFDCLKQLAPEVRLAVLMRCQEGYSYEEMGRLSRERPATLQARVTRALPILRRCIENRESFGEERAG